MKPTDTISDPTAVGHSHAPATTPSALTPRAITPLWAVLAFTFANSIGGGVVTTGYAFLAESAYGYTVAQNYWLGLLQGAVYVGGALTVGPALGRALLRVRWLTTRRVLAALMVALAVLSMLPWVARRGADPTDRAAGEWALWLLIAGYSVLTGVLWPIVESYLSGGREGLSLRRATGWFNVTWSGALVAAFWVMGPLKEKYALELIVGVGVIHVICLGLLATFTVNPPGHSHDDAHDDPDAKAHARSYPGLLKVFRMELVAGYMVYSALGSWMPAACKTLGVAEAWQTPMVATWLATRVIAFAIMQRWHGWHGRWSTSIWGAGLLLSGFAACVLATTVAEAAGFAAGLAMMLVGLAGFGLAMGVIYCAALYYAMAVGKAQVDAGGKHEALIGTGFGAGPACGLLATAGVAQGWASADSFNVVMLTMVATLAVIAVAAALWSARRHARA